MNKKIITLLSISLATILVLFTLQPALGHQHLQTHSSPLFTHRITQATQTKTTTTTTQQNHPLFPHHNTPPPYLKSLQNILTPLTDHQLTLLSTQLYHIIQNQYPQEDTTQEEVHQILATLKEQPEHVEQQIRNEEPNPFVSMMFLSLCLPGPRCLLGIYLLIILILLQLRNQSNDTAAYPFLNRFTNV